MNNFTVEHNGFTFKRITRKTAKTAYKNGLSVIFCPCNLLPFGTIYNAGITVKYSDFDTDKTPENHFDGVVNSFEYYNCINSNTGKYTAFYIPVKHDNNGAIHYDYDYLVNRVK